MTGKKPEMKTSPDSRVTIHMAASLDGFIARKDGRGDWLETSDEFAGGDTMDPGFVEAFLKSIDCYVMVREPMRRRWVLKPKDWDGCMGTNPFSSSPVASCRGPWIPSNSTQAISRSS